MLRFVGRRPRTCLGWSRLDRRARPRVWWEWARAAGSDINRRSIRAREPKRSYRAGKAWATQTLDSFDADPSAFCLVERAVSQSAESILASRRQQRFNQIRGRRMGRRQFVHPKAYRKELFASTDRAEPRRRPMQTDLHYPVPPLREERRRCRRERERKKRARLSLARHSFDGRLKSRIQKKSLLLYYMCIDDKPEKGQTRRINQWINRLTNSCSRAINGLIKCF